MAAVSRRRWLRWLILAALLALTVLGAGYWNATRDPIVRRATLTLADWPQGAPPVSLLLISDTHVAGPDMPPSRLRRIFDSLNKLNPDVVLLAGDFISEKRVATRLYPPDELTAPFAVLRSWLGVFAVMGNHDHWSNAPAIAAGFRKANVVVLSNEAVRVGPVIIGGVDDEFTGHDNLAATFAAMDALGRGPRVILSHGPDIVPHLPAPVAFVAAGHTHCGQIALPVIGAITYVSRYGSRFACGLINDRGQRVVVAAGLGTSIVPLRFGAPPDVWLITLAPPAAGPKA